MPTDLAKFDSFGWSFAPKLTTALTIQLQDSCSYYAAFRVWPTTFFFLTSHRCQKKCSRIFGSWRPNLAGKWPWFGQFKTHITVACRILRTIWETSTLHHSTGMLRLFVLLQTSFSRTILKQGNIRFFACCWLSTEIAFALLISFRRKELPVALPDIRASSELADLPQFCELTWRNAFYSGNFSVERLIFVLY